MGENEILALASSHESAKLRVMNTRTLTVLAVLLASACSDPADSAPAARIEATTAQAEPENPESRRQALAIDPARSTVGFTGSKPSGHHDGTFGEFTGSIELDPESIEGSRVSVTIQMASAQIEPADLRTHLLSADFFDVQTYPTATFESTRIVALAGMGRSHTVTGNLTLHGASRALTFPAQIDLTPTEVRARAEFTINRQDFGIIYPGMANDLIRDGVVIRFDVRAPRS